MRPGWVLTALVLSAVLNPGAACADDAADIAKIDSAWATVTREANALQDRILATVADGDATERYNAYKNLIAMMMDMYTEVLYRSSSRDQPEYLVYTTPITNSCAPSMMTRYGVAYVEPGATYRVWGKRGNPVDIDVQQWSSYSGVDKSYPVAATGRFAQTTFSAQGIRPDKQGRFEFILGPEKPAKGQWLKLEENTRMVMFRDFYADYSKDAIPPVYHLEKLGPRDRGPTTLSPDEAAQRLLAFAQAMKSWDICFRGGTTVPLHSFIKKIFSSNPDDPKSGSGQQVDQTYYLSEFNLPPGQAMVVEWTPPASYLNWNLQLNTRLRQNFNFGARQVDLTASMAHADGDGKIRFVISHEDPGVANWLDLDGNQRGLIWLRCKKCSANGIPAAKVVPTGQIMENLPPETKMVSAEERQKQLDLRRRHYISRYSY